MEATNEAKGDGAEDVGNEMSQEKACKMALSLKSQGNEHFKQKDYVNAKYSYTESLQYNEYDSKVWCNRCLIHIKLGEMFEAVFDGKKAIELAPEWGKAWLRLAHAYELGQDLENYPFALQYAQTALECEPSNTLFQKEHQRITEIHDNLLLGHMMEMHQHNFEQFDIDGDGFLNYDEFNLFWRIVNNNVDYVLPKDEWETIKYIKYELPAEFREHLVATFDKISRNPNERNLNYEEMVRLVGICHPEWDSPQVAEVVEIFLEDYNQKYHLTYENLINLFELGWRENPQIVTSELVNLGCSAHFNIDEDQYANVQIPTNIDVLDFEQFLKCIYHPTYELAYQEWLENEDPSTTAVQITRFQEAWNLYNSVSNQLLNVTVIEIIYQFLGSNEPN